MVWTLGYDESLSFFFHDEFSMLYIFHSFKSYFFLLLVRLKTYAPIVMTMLRVFPFLKQKCKRLLKVLFVYLIVDVNKDLECPAMLT